MGKGSLTLKGQIMAFDMMTIHAGSSIQEKRQFLENAFSRAYENVILAAQSLNWKFSRGRPSPALLVEQWVNRYPTYGDAIIRILQRECPNKLQNATPVNPPGVIGNIPPEWDDSPKAPNHPAPMPAPVIEPAPKAQQPDIDLTPIQRAIEGLQQQLHALQNLQRDGQEHDRTIQNALSARIDDLSARLFELEKRTPIQITVGEIALPVISGQHACFPLLVKGLLSLPPKSRQALLVGPAGTGKTTAAIEFATLQGLDFYAQPQTQDSSGILGYVDAKGEFVETDFFRAWTNPSGAVYLIDELSMNGADALGALNAALANGFAVFPKYGVIHRHEKFYCIAGDNSDTGASLKYPARNALDNSTLDRFQLRIQWDIDPIIESKMAGKHADWHEAVKAIRVFIETRGIQLDTATPRAVDAGRAYLDAGLLTRDEVLRVTLYRSLLIPDWEQIIKLPAVREFLAGAIF